jgi:hypothetical protein
MDRLVGDGYSVSTASVSTPKVATEIVRSDAKLVDPKSVVSLHSIDERAVKQTESPTTRCIYALIESKASKSSIDFSKITFRIFASQTFISDALKIFPDELITFMNSWDTATMNKFIECYDTLPEAMLGNLFAHNLNLEVIPEDIRLSQAFICVAANKKPDRVVKMLSEETTQNSRLASKGISEHCIGVLFSHGLPMSKISLCERSPEELKIADENRFAQEIEKPINFSVRQKVSQQALELRSARAT